MYRMKLGWKLRKIGRTVFLTDGRDAFEISDISYDVLNYITKPKSLEEVVDFVGTTFEGATQETLQADMADFLNEMISRGIVRAS